MVGDVSRRSRGLDGGLVSRHGGTGTARRPVHPQGGPEHRRPLTRQLASFRIRGVADRRAPSLPAVVSPANGLGERDHWHGQKGTDGHQQSKDDHDSQEGHHDGADHEED